MKSFLGLIILIYFASAEAAFQKIWDGYKKSKLHQSKLVEEKISASEFNFTSNSMDWQFVVTPTHQRQLRDAFFDFQGQETISTSTSFELVKPSYEWGSVSLKHEFISYNLENWDDSARRGLNTEVFESVNTLSYSYDFFDKSNAMDLRLSETKREQTEVESKLNVEQAQFDFFKVYIQAKLQVFSVELNKEFLTRAKKRYVRTQKRVRDGLSRKVELLQARNSVLTQEELLESSRSNLKQNLAIIEYLVGYQIPEQFFKTLSWNLIALDDYKNLIKPNEHLSIKALKNKLEYIENQIEKIEESSGYKLVFSASYSANDIDESAATTRENSFAGLTATKTVGLALTIPLGQDKRDGLTNWKMYQKKKNELDLQVKKEEVQITKNALMEQIEFLNKAVTIAKNRVSVAQKTMDEINRLYLRGQATFEEVIRSEEAYINAKLSEKKGLANYDTLLGNYAFLNNQLDKLLNIYKD